MLSVKNLRSLIRPLAISILVIASTTGVGAARSLDASHIVDLEQQRIDDVRHSYEIKVIDRLLAQYHYKDFHLDDALSVSILNNFIDSLDPARLFFSATDVKEINRLKNDFDDYIRRGITAAYHSIFDIYRIRVEERIDYALQRLEHKFNFSIDEFYELDRSESAWALDENELNSLWRKRIKNDLINLYLSDESEEDSLDTLRRRYKSIVRRSQQIKDNEIFQIYVNAYANAIEPHTGYFSPRATEEFNISMRLSLQGIGAVLRSDDDQTEIVSIVPGGPADQSAQIHADDKILAVAQGAEGELVDIFGWRLSDVVDLIRGPKGSSVRLSILPGELGPSATAREVTIVRDKIKLDSQAARSRILEVETEAGKSRLGIIVLPSFYIDFEGRSNGDKDYRSTTRDVAKLINNLNQQQVEGIIIDLRGNGGGSLEEVITLTGLFIDEGPVVQVKNSDGRVRTHSDRQRGALYEGPLAVMVDRQSASASEIFAGAIQDYKRGLIVGEPTFGKGTVQNVLPLSAYAKKQFKDDLGQIKITIAQFFRINGDSTQHRGVIPDIRWPYRESSVEPFGERAFVNALPWRHISESDYITSSPPIDNKTLEHLKMRHEKRIEQDAAFIAELDKYKLLVETRIETSVSLDKNARQHKREAFGQRLLDAENQIRLAGGEETYPSYKEMREQQVKRRDENAYRSDAPIKPDPYMLETANILNDLLHIASPLLVESGTAISNDKFSIGPD